MKHYAIDLIITDEDGNKQVIQLRAPHLTGKQVHDLVGISVEGIVIEPEPVILTAPKPKKFRLKKKKSKPVIAPEGFNGKEIERL